MDKSWLAEKRSSIRYLYGLHNFINSAFHTVAQGNEILCPCKNCKNCSWGNREDVFEHLFCDGFDARYKQWTFHGERISSRKPFDKKHEKDHLHDDLDMI
jgi:hypothetical protein